MSTEPNNPSMKVVFRGADGKLYRATLTRKAKPVGMSEGNVGGSDLFDLDFHPADPSLDDAHLKLLAAYRTAERTGDTITANALEPFLRHEGLLDLPDEAPVSNAY